MRGVSMLADRKQFGAVCPPEIWRGRRSRRVKRRATLGQNHEIVGVERTPDPVADVNLFAE
jgi:hypothetical protein